MIQKPRRSQASLVALPLLALTAALALGCGGLVVVERDRGDEGQGGQPGDSTGASGVGWDSLGCGDIYGQIAKDPNSHAMVCVNLGGSEACPNIYAAIGYIAPSRPCSYIVSVDCGPNAVGPSCCYLVTEEAASCP